MSDAERVRLAREPEAARVRRLGRNLNGYLGETIDLATVLRDCHAAATRHGWAVTDVPVNERLSFAAFIRSGSISDSSEAELAGRKPRIYLSAGIHGDEPAGLLAVRRLLEENNWPEGFGLWLCPCLNPDGCLMNRRENAQGLDLNRQYLEPQAAETEAHIAWLQRQPSFDLCLCLHEDWESAGFYVYELNPEDQPSLAQAIVTQVAPVCPIDESELIEGRPARNGVIRPEVDPRSRPQWPESFYLLTYKTRLSYTLEAPSDFPLDCRVAALVAGVKGALESFTQARGFSGPAKIAPIR